MSAIIDTYDPDFILAATDTLAICERIAASEEEMTAETLALIDSICAEVSEIVGDLEVDFSDSLADLDAIMDRHGL